MSENSVDAEIVKRTQEVLGKFVKKPPLSEKLLRKPPFKFILDIVKAVIRDTHFLENLYSDEELNAEKDREGKMKFLQKLIDVVQLVTQQDLQIKTSKIVAGLEADKTNKLFQAIGYALENNLDSTEAVVSVKSGKVPAKAKVSKNEQQKASKQGTVGGKQVRDKTPAKPEVKKVTAQRSIESKSKSNAVSKEKVASKGKVDSRKLKKVPSKDGEKKIEEKIITNGSIESYNSVSPPREESIEKPKNEDLLGSKVDQLLPQPTQQQTPVSQPQQVEEKEAPAPDEPKVNGDINHHPVEPEKKEPESIHKPQDELAAIIDEEAEFRRKEKSTKRLSSRHRQKSVEDGSQDKNSTEAHAEKPQVENTEKLHKKESFERPRTSLRPPSARPASSRPAAPRRRDKNIEIVLQPDDGIKLANMNVKMENFSKELEDDGENLIIIEDPAAASENFLNDRLSKGFGNDGNDNGSLQSDDHGHLVQQILETEKNFEGALGMDGSEVKKVEIEYDDTKMQTNMKQIEQVKDLIQKLVRSLNPMGKLMDFVQEDVDSMQREYVKWNETFKQASLDLKREQMETLSAVEPLKYQLNQLEKMIAEHHQMIDQLRGNLVLSEQRINKIFME